MTKRINYKLKIATLGYTASRGAYSGTTTAHRIHQPMNDNIHGWYLDPLDGRSALDRRGPGFRTLREAYETLCERLDVDPERDHRFADTEERPIRINLTLDPVTIGELRRVGDGSVSAGIRKMVRETYVS